MLMCVNSSVQGQSVSRAHFAINLASGFISFCLLFVFFVVYLFIFFSFFKLQLFVKHFFFFFFFWGGGGGGAKNRILYFISVCTVYAKISAIFRDSFNGNSNLWPIDVYNITSKIHCFNH